MIKKFLEAYFFTLKNNIPFDRTGARRFLQIVIDSSRAEKLGQGRNRRGWQQTGQRRIYEADEGRTAGVAIYLPDREKG